MCIYRIAKRGTSQSVARLSHCCQTFRLTYEVGRDLFPLGIRGVNLSQWAFLLHFWFARCHHRQLADSECICWYIHSALKRVSFS